MGVERSVSVLYLDLVGPSPCLVFKRRFFLSLSKECVTKFTQERKDGTGLHFAGVADDW